MKKHKQHSEPLSPMEDAELDRPGQDSTERFPIDEILRKRGYTIKSRPNQGEAVWERNGHEFLQSRVLEREKIVDARKRA